MSVATQITDHTQQALDNLISRYADSSNLRALLTALVDAIQDAEDLAYPLATIWDIDVAGGVNLDRIGAIVGQTRASLDDTTYRKYIKARVRANRSNGVKEDIIATLEGIVPDGSTTSVVGYYPAGFLVRILDAAISAADLAILGEFVEAARGAAINASVIGAAYTANNGPFQFAVTEQLNGALAGTETSIPCDLGNLALFPNSGSIIVGPHTANEETVTYAFKTPSGFGGVAGLSNSHSDNDIVTLASQGSGFADGISWGTANRQVDLEQSSSQYLSITDAASDGSLDPSGDFTLQVRCTFESTANDPGLMMKNATSPNLGYSFYYENGSSALRFYGSTAGTSSDISALSSTWTPTLEVEYMLTVTFDSVNGVIQFFVDGTQLGTDISITPATIYDNAAAFYVGGGAFSYYYFDGEIDEARLWSKVRTATEIAADYNKTLAGSEANLDGYWPMLGNGNDAAGTNNLTASGAPVYVVHPTIYAQGTGGIHAAAVGA